jgi:hypothetical protein
MRCMLALLPGAALLLAGCGTTRWSDTQRTATEQLLISDAVDRAISQIDFKSLAGHDVYIDNKYIAGEVDERYVVSTLRQHMLASGCTIRDRPEDARLVLEIRSGAVGTNRNDLLYGVPQTSLPTGGAFPGVPASIPEIPLFKRTAQQGVCKIAVFAYDRYSGHPVWQSGTRQVASKTKDVWIFGAGPFTRGTIHDGTRLAGEHLDVPLAGDKKKRPQDNVWVAHEILFPEPPKVSAGPDPVFGVGQASFYGPISPPASGPSSPGHGASSGGSAASNNSSSGGAANNGTTSPFNPAAAAVGAVNAIDWANSLRAADRPATSGSTTSTTVGSAPGQTPAALRPKGP